MVHEFSIGQRRLSMQDCGVVALAAYNMILVVAILLLE
jgi:hypothetical protein